MRWKNGTPNIGDVRHVKRFLFFPLTIDDETRWLEKVTWKEKYGYKTIVTKSSNDTPPHPPSIKFSAPKWIKIAWIN